MVVTQEVVNMVSATTGRTVRGWALVASLRSYMKHGSSSAREGLIATSMELTQAVLSSPSFSGQPKDLPGLSDIVQSSALGVIFDAQSTADAACVVLLHSIMDAAASEFCSATSLIAPERWYPEFEGKKSSLTVQEIVALGADAFYKVELTRHMKAVEKISLPNRIERLQAICRPGTREILPNYKYDRERMESLDRLRHQIVHENALGQALQEIAEELEFMRLTNAYLSGLVTTSFQFQIGMGPFMQALYTTPPLTSP